MTTTTPTIADRVASLNAWITEGRILDAMHEFYTEDIAMQENANPPTVGRDANLVREQQFLDNVKQWQAYTVKSVGVDDAAGVSLIESTIDFIDVNDQPVHMEQVSVQRWTDGRIAHERFYYDASGGA